jgi:lysozyme
MDFILEEDIDKKQAGLHDALPWVATLDDARQNVLMNMAFNLGVAGLLEFTKTLNFVKRREYEKASVEMLDSDWAKQVGERAKRLAKVMKTGVL